MIVDPNSADDLARAEKVNEQIVQYALERKGTCTGEHGVGIGKLKYQAKEHGGAYQIMQKIKQVLDPMGILNPNKKVTVTPVSHSFGSQL
jgi:D-lactate dehydrogenase (cytochrome)